MRIGFVTQWFPPEPVTVSSGIASGLASRGHHVDVLTGFPNYPDGVLSAGYRVRPYQREDYAPGVVVHRAPLYPSHDTSTARRMANYASFAAGAALVAVTRLTPPDVWLAYSSPATAVLPGLTGSGAGAVRDALRRGGTRSGDRPPGRRAPHYQIVQDLWPDSVTGSGMGGRAVALAEPLLAGFCRWGYRHSAGIGVISPGMRAVLRERGVPDERIYDTPNWTDSPAPLPWDDDRRDAARTELGLPSGRLFLYAGNLGELQALPELVAAFAQVPQAHLVLVGNGTARERVAADLARRALPNLHLLPAQPPDRIEAYLAAADVLVVSLADTPLLRVTMPSKVQASLAAGRPVLAHAAGDAAAVVAGAGAGLAASPQEHTRVVSAVAELAAAPVARLREMGAAGRALFERDYTRAAGLDRLEHMLTAHLRPDRGDVMPVDRRGV